MGRIPTLSGRCIGSHSWLTCHHVKDLIAKGHGATRQFGRSVACYECSCFSQIDRLGVSLLEIEIVSKVDEVGDDL